jgi:hypothetical protein
MSTPKVPITRIGKFFGQEDFELDVEIGQEWLHGDMNFTIVLYRVDRYKTKTDNVYGETVSDGVKFLSPVELKSYVQILQPTNGKLGNTKINQSEPGNIKFAVYQNTLDELDVSISLGDYIGYYESENKVRYYTIVDDGRINSDNKHTYAGYKPFYRSYIGSPVTTNEFRGL